MLQKELYLKIFNNKILRKLVFENIYDIHNKSNKSVLSWGELLKKPASLASYNYISLFKESLVKDDGIINKIDYEIYTIINKIVSFGHIECLKAIVDYCKDNKITFDYIGYNFSYSNLIGFAAKYGRFDVLQYLEKAFDGIIRWNYLEATQKAVLSRDLSIFKYLAAKVDKKQKDALEMNALDMLFESAGVGAIDIFIYVAMTYNPTVPARILANTGVRGGHLELIEFLYENYDLNSTNNGGFYSTELKGKTLLDMACHHGQLEILEWLHEKGVEDRRITINAIDIVAAGGGNSVTQFSQLSSSQNCLKMMKWLHANGYGGCTSSAMDNAACRNDFEMVKWLHENRTEGCTTQAMMWAVYNRNLDMVKWFHENRSEGCLPNAVNRAVRNKDFRMIKWFHENIPRSFDYGAMDIAAENGDLDLIIWLQKHRTEGCSTVAMDEAARRSHIDIVKWLHENRTEGCTTKAMDSAAQNGDMELIKWLHENRTEGCTTEAMDSALERENIELIKWLKENRSEGYSVDGLMSGNSTTLSILNDYT